MKIVSRAQKSSRDLFISAFQRSLYSSLSLFSAKGIVSNTWRHRWDQQGFEDSSRTMIFRYWNLLFWSLSFLPSLPHCNKYYCFVNSTVSFSKDCAPRRICVCLVLSLLGKRPSTSHWSNIFGLCYLLEDLNWYIVFINGHNSVLI